MSVCIICVHVHVCMCMHVQCECFGTELHFGIYDIICIGHSKSVFLTCRLSNSKQISMQSVKTEKQQLVNLLTERRNGWRRLEG